MPTPRLNRFQIHLSTAVVLMFVAGGMIWINALEQKENSLKRYGFPRAFWEKEVVWESGFMRFIGPDGIVLDLPRAQNKILFSSKFHFWNALIDLAVVASVLMLVFVILEWIIRRRATRKEIP